MAAENKLAPAPSFHDWHKPLILLKNRIMKLYFPIGNKNFGKRILYSKISLVLLQSILQGLIMNFSFAKVHPKNTVIV